MGEYKLSDAEIDEAIKRADEAILNFNRGGEYVVVQKLFDRISKLRELGKSWSSISKILDINLTAEKLRNTYTKVNDDIVNNPFAIEEKKKRVKTVKSSIQTSQIKADVVAFQ